MLMSKHDFLYLNYIGLIGIITELMLILAYQNSSVYAVTLATSAGLVFAFVYDWLFFGEVAGHCSILGGILIVGSVSYDAVVKIFFVEDNDDDDNSNSNSYSKK